MATQRWTESRTSVYNIGYHLIWCPKYRREILKGDIEKSLKQLLKQKSKDINVKIERMEVMPDHVHLFVKTSPVASPHWVVQQFKGITSNRLRKEFPSINSRLPTLWTRSYYCESVGHISDKTIKKYIEDQKSK